MISAKFKSKVEEGLGGVVIMAGSDSDEPHIEKIVKSLEGYSIPYEVRICSAHKQPDELYEMIREYNDIFKPLAIVAVAGGTDALSGTVSYHSMHPVISCPPDAPNNSCLTNPPGSSNAYIARPENVGRFVAQMFSSFKDFFYRTMLDGDIVMKVNKLIMADSGIREKYENRQAGKADEALKEIEKSGGG